MKTAPASTVTIEPELLRKRDVAEMLALSEREVDNRVDKGELTPIRIPGIRAIRFAVADVRALAARWRATSAGASNDDRG